MPRVYAVTFSAVAVTAAQDLIAIVAATNQSLELHSVYLAQHSDAGDAQDEMLQVAIKRGATTVGSGGGAFTPLPLDASDAAAGATARINDTTPASSGTIVTLHSDAFNVRGGWAYRPTPEERIIVKGGVRLTVNLVSTPADSLTMNATLLFREIG